MPRKKKETENTTDSVEVKKSDLGNTRYSDYGYYSMREKAKFTKKK